MNSATESATAPSTIREAPAIRPFAEPDPNRVHWSELDRSAGFGAQVRPELLGRDVRTFFGRFG